MWRGDAKPVWVPRDGTLLGRSRNRTIVPVSIVCSSTTSATASSSPFRSTRSR